MRTRLMLLCGAVLAFGLLLEGCKVDTDLGKECTLVKRDPNATDPHAPAVPITEADFPDGEPQGDLISFGATGCEDLVCVQDAQHREWQNDPTHVLTGYCSNSCVQGSATACSPQANADDDKNPDMAMSCRALLLDSATMGRLCQTDPAKCQQYFGNNTSPYFCARGGTPPATDAGTP